MKQLNMIAYFLCLNAIGYVEYTSPISADILTQPLPELVGSYPSGDRNTAFDFGTAFQKIESVRIDVSGMIEPGIGVRSPVGGSYQWPAESWFRWPTEFSFGMGDSLKRSMIHANTAPWIGPYHQEATFTPFYDSNYDFLLDGKGEVHSSLWSWILVGGVSIDRIQYFDHMISSPYGEISQATLIVEGVPVPEPASLITVGIGIVGLACVYYRLKPSMLQSVTARGL